MARERTASRELTKLSEVVAKWRAQHGGKGSKIPDELWDEAVRVAGIDGMWRTAKTLRFRYGRLKEQSARSDGSERTKVPVETAPAVKVRGEEQSRASEPGNRGARRLYRRARAELALANTTAPSKLKGRSHFVAVEMGSLPGGGGAIIELAGRHGDRMRVEVTGGVDVCSLVENFWRREP
jgi:hypothetical protein